ncbi:MAG: hypothetical protein RLZZ502_634 [Pseudomonadota bacterium]|jgi:environmental stress-induced protein Ves
MQKWHHIHLAQVDPEPWRNGGGLTRTLLAWPETQWLVRASVAEIHQDGPFSRFDGIDRAFAVLSGEGVLLGERRIQKAQALHVFSGEEAPYCRLLGGTTVDLNFMWQREQIEVSLTPQRHWACALFSHTHLSLKFTEQLQELVPVADDEYVLAWRRRI